MFLTFDPVISVIEFYTKEIFIYKNVQQNEIWKKNWKQIL